MQLHDFAPIEQVIDALQAGKMIILFDDENRENEGDLVLSASHVTAEAINFMSRYARGLICLPMAGELIDRLKLPPMVAQNTSPYGTAFTVSIEAAQGVSTGISAFDRAHTIQVAVAPDSCPEDVISPGHVFPLRAQDNGVFARRGQTEGSVDLMRLAGLTPAAVICEIMNEDGTMSRYDALVQFAKQHQLLLARIQDIMAYRLHHDQLLQAMASCQLPIQALGDFTLTVFKSLIDNEDHLMLATQMVPDVPLVRIHSECITGDVFHSNRCDCGHQLQASLQKIAEEGGILIYLRQEGRGVGLVNKLKAYALQEQGLDTVEANLALGLPADSRDYSLAYQMLRDAGIKKVRLLTNNPHKARCLEDLGIEVCERIDISILPTVQNRDYLRTKKIKLGHLLSID